MEVGIARGPVKYVAEVQIASQIPKGNPPGTFPFALEIPQHVPSSLDSSLCIAYQLESRADLVPMTLDWTTECPLRVGVGAKNSLEPPSGPLDEFHPTMVPSGAQKALTTTGVVMCGVGLAVGLVSPFGLAGCAAGGAVFRWERSTHSSRSSASDTS